MMKKRRRALKNIPKAVKEYQKKSNRGVVFIDKRTNLATLRLLRSFQKSVYKDFQRQKNSILKTLKEKKIYARLETYSRRVHPELWEEKEKALFEKKKISKKDMEVINRWIEGIYDEDIDPEKMERILQAWYPKAANIAGTQALRQLGIKLAFNLKNADMIESFKERGTKIAGNISNKTLNDFRNVLYTAYMEEGMSPYEVAKRIEGMFENTYKGRAMMIARTETLVSQSTTQHKTYKENKVEMKQWQAIIDDRTRESHAYADGQLVPIDEPFDVMGIAMMHPGDGDAPADEVIGCRCVELPVVTTKPASGEEWTGEDYEEEE